MIMAEQRATEVVDYRFVKPTGNILNDSDSGVDYLEHSVYAEALAEKIDRVTTPITIGVFARWGSGKSFLLKHVRNLLERRQRQNSVAEKSSGGSRLNWRVRCCLRTFFFVFFLSVIIVSAMWVAHPSMFLTSLTASATNPGLSDSGPTMEVYANTTSPAPPHPEVTTSSTDFSNHFSRFIALGVLLLSLVVIGVVVCGNSQWWSSELHKNLRLILFVAFTKLPIKSFEKAIVTEVYDNDVKIQQDSDVDVEVASNKKYIFVNFNAWEYAGSDTLWAGIITTLSNAIEAEFGSVTTRFFRMLKVRVMPREERKEDLPKTKDPILFTKFCEARGTSRESRKLVRETMMQYGVVKKCVPLRDWPEREPTGFEDWWVTHFSNIKEAQGACEKLNTLGIEAVFSNPSKLISNRPIPAAQNHTSPQLHRVEDPPANATTTFITPQQNPSSSSSSVPDFQEGDTTQSCCKHFLKHPKTICYLPNLFWHILAVFALIALPVITYMLAGMLHLDVYRTGRAVPIVVQIVSWLPAVGAAAFVIMRFIWAMFHSQRTRINSALAGTRGNMATQLGFMNKVKTEVEYITKLLKCAEYSHNKQYKVIISIDDLDRCALDKIKSVFEAVSILLSDHSSPFVCLVAVDSRVAVKCIEDTMSAALVKSNVNGYEYLKKIINLPFCLPEIDTKMKKRFIVGLIDLADETKKKVVRRYPTTPSSTDPMRRSTIDSRPPMRTDLTHYTLGGRIPGTSAPPSVPRSATRDSFDSHYDLDNEASYLLRNPSQRPLITDHRLSMKPSNSIPVMNPLQHRDSTIPSGLNDVPDGVPISDPESREGLQSDAIITDDIPFVEEACTTERSGEIVRDKSAADKSARDESAQIVEANQIRENEAEPHEIQSATIEPPRDAGDSTPEVPCVVTRHTTPLNTAAFLYKCRDFLYNNEIVLRHVEGNPRNIKRIFNVLSLTSWILHCYKKERKRSDFLLQNCAVHRGRDVERCELRSLHNERSSKPLPVMMSGELAEDLVVWVVLTDQWPYRMSYLMEVLEDLEQRPPSEGNSPVSPDAPLLDIYEKCVRPEMDRIKDDDYGLLTMDIHPDMFVSFLQEIKEHGLLRSKPISLRKITINLDQSLRQTIVRQREGLLKRTTSKSSVSSAK